MEDLEAARTNSVLLLHAATFLGTRLVRSYIHNHASATTGSDGSPTERHTAGMTSFAGASGSTASRSLVQHTMMAQLVEQGCSRGQYRSAWLFRLLVHEGRLRCLLVQPSTIYDIPCLSSNLLRAQGVPPGGAGKQRTLTSSRAD